MSYSDATTPSPRRSTHCPAKSTATASAHWAFSLRGRATVCVGRQVGDDAACAWRFFCRRLWRADKDLPAAGTIFRRRRLEWSFDPNRADVREERVAGGRDSLHRRTHEMAIEVE